MSDDNDFLTDDTSEQIRKLALTLVNQLEGKLEVLINEDIQTCASKKFKRLKPFVWNRTDPSNTDIQMRLVFDDHKDLIVKTKFWPTGDLVKIRLWSTYGNELHVIKVDPKSIIAQLYDRYVRACLTLKLNNGNYEIVPFTGRIKNDRCPTAFNPGDR